MRKKTQERQSGDPVTWPDSATGDHQSRADF